MIIKSMYQYMYHENKIILVFKYAFRNLLHTSREKKKKKKGQKFLKFYSDLFKIIS